MRQLNAQLRCLPVYDDQLSVHPLLYLEISARSPPLIYYLWSRHSRSFISQLEYLYHMYCTYKYQHDEFRKSELTFSSRDYNDDLK